MLTFDVNLDLIFGIPDKEINAEINVKDNQIPKTSKHSDDWTLTSEENDAHSSSTSRVNVERVQVSRDDQVEGEHLTYLYHNERQDLHVKGDVTPRSWYTII